MIYNWYSYVCVCHFESGSVWSFRTSFVQLFHSFSLFVQPQKLNTCLAAWQGILWSPPYLTRLWCVPFMVKRRLGLSDNGAFWGLTVASGADFLCLFANLCWLNMFLKKDGTGKSLKKSLLTCVPSHPVILIHVLRSFCNIFLMVNVCEATNKHNPAQCSPRITMASRKSLLQIVVLCLKTRGL